MVQVDEGWEIPGVGETKLSRMPSSWRFLGKGCACDSCGVCWVRGVWYLVGALINRQSSAPLDTLRDFTTTVVRCMPEPGGDPSTPGILRRFRIRVGSSESQ